MKDENVIENLKKYNQTRTLKNKIIEQLKDINFPQLKELYNNIKEEAEVDIGELKPIKSLNPDKISKEERETYEEIGADIVRNKKFAVATMSGGQGTRLGYKGAKGTFKIDVEPEPKYLFEIIVDTLQRANKKYDTIIPWYIMTSHENNKEIINFVEEHNYFGYNKDFVGFFEQGELPLITEDGQIMLDENYNIKKASDGNGSIFKSMYMKGVLDDMKEKGIEELFYAVRRLKEENEDFVLDLAGFFEDIYKKQVEELEQLGIAHFYGFQSDPRPFYAEADCVVLPSYHEGMSNVLLEAAATGRPVITSNIPGCRESVENGKSGLLVEVKNKEMLYQAMKKMLHCSREEREKMGKAGREKMKREFRKEAVVERTVRSLE